MNSRKCWKRCEKGWHVKGTKFEDGDIPVEKVQQNVQNTPNIENSQEYPWLQPVWNRTHNQEPLRKTHDISPLSNSSVPPPTLDEFKCDVCPVRFKYKTVMENHMESQHGIPTEYKCDECPARFSYKNELRNHFNKDHCNTELEKEAHFLGMVKQSLLRVLPNALEMALSGMNQQETESPQNGSSNSQMRWKLVPASLN